MPSRRTLISGISAASVVAALLGLTGAGYATEVEPRSVRVTRRAVSPPGWPVARPMRIAILTDTHSHPRSMNLEDLAGVVARTNDERPDLVVLLGDYGSQSRGAFPPEEVARVMSGLKAPQGVYAIQGNHDWWDDREAMRRGHGPTRVQQAFEGAGIAFLENRAVPLGDGGSLWLAGIESEEAAGSPFRTAGLDAYRLGKLAGILAGVPADATVILLAHEPDIFANDLDPRIALTLSGHTHGGQVRILGWSPVIPSRYGRRYAYGHVVERGRHLVVSCGLGSHFVAGRPLRIGMRPEIAIVDVSAPVVG